MAAAGMSLDGTQESWQCKGCKTYNFASRTVCRTCSVIRWPAAVVLTAGSATAKTQFPKNSTQTRSYANGGKAGPREGPKRAKGKEGKGYGQPSTTEEQPSDKTNLNRLQQIRTSLQQAGASTAALSTLDADIRSLRETMEDTRSLDEQLMVSLGPSSVRSGVHRQREMPSPQLRASSRKRRNCSCSTAGPWPRCSAGSGARLASSRFFSQLCEKCRRGYPTHFRTLLTGYGVQRIGRQSRRR